MMSKKMIKIICIIMAVLMALSACAVLVSVVAIDEEYYQTYVNPQTGDSDGDYLVPAGIAVVAILALIICIALPKMKKEDDYAEDKTDGEDKDNKSVCDISKKSSCSKEKKPEIIKSKKD